MICSKAIKVESCLLILESRKKSETMVINRESRVTVCCWRCRFEPKDGLMETLGKVV